jgi:hypothetical protein
MSQSNKGLRLEAKVERSTGSTKHIVPEPGEGKIGMRDNEIVESVAKLVIEERDDAFYLLYLDASGNCLTDTWHATLEDAKDQARFEFSVFEECWSRILH